MARETGAAEWTYTAPAVAAGGRALPSSSATPPEDTGNCPCRDGAGERNSMAMAAERIHLTARAGGQVTGALRSMTEPVPGGAPGEGDR